MKRITTSKLNLLILVHIKQTIMFSNRTKDTNDITSFYNMPTGENLITSESVFLSPQNDNIFYKLYAPLTFIALGHSSHTPSTS